MVKNPLAALKVASERKFKMMFDFSRANKLAFDVSKEIQQTQPYGTTGATASFARGASSSIKEAMAIKRKAKKSKPQMMLPKMSMPEMKMPHMEMKELNLKKKISGKI